MIIAISLKYVLKLLNIIPIEIQCAWLQQRPVNKQSVVEKIKPNETY